MSSLWWQRGFSGNLARFCAGVGWPKIHCFSAIGDGRQVLLESGLPDIERSLAADDLYLSVLLVRSRK